ncbi:beta-glucosidase family protein, partial [Liquorilactobacillus ghanensis]
MLKNTDLISKLSLEQKAGLLSGKTTWETLAVGGLIPSIFLSDGPHGLRKQSGATDHLGLNASEPATCFPTAATLANSWDPEIIGEVGVALGNEAKSLGVQVILGPGLNIKRNPLGGRNFEYYSEDPYLTGKLGAAIIRGIQSTGTFASPKHFAANNQEYRRMASNSVIDERTLRELYTTNFEIAIKEGNPKVIMSSYNQVNGVYANENHYLLKQILRNEWKFDGFVVTDWGGDNDHVAGVINGSNLAMPTLGINGPLELINAVNSGKLKEEVIDKRVDELLSVILESTATDKQKQVINWRHQHQVAHDAAVESIVLLKNDNGVLPLNKESKVALIGDFAQRPRYQGAGSSLVNTKNLETITECIKNYPLTTIGFAQGYTRANKQSDKEQLRNEAIKLAEKSDVAIVCVGLDEISESEGADRQNMRLPGAQESLLAELFKTTTPIVIVLSAGSPVEMPWADQATALVHGYLGGEAGASAMLDVLTGKHNPSGKLAETYPMKYIDTPFANEFPAKGKDSFYKEGPFVGYRYYNTINKKVRFPFGYGLSYTTFSYENLKVDQEKVSLTITNTGAVAGSEIVQLYVGNKNSSLIRPAKELKGFAKVYLNSGESREVTIYFDDKTFRYYNTDSHTFAIEDGIYQIYICGNVNDIRLFTEIHVDGTKAQNQALLFPKYFSHRISEITLTDFSDLYGKEVSKENNTGFLMLRQNNTISEMKYAKNWIARIISKFLKK